MRQNVPIGIEWLLGGSRLSCDRRPLSALPRVVRGPRTTGSGGGAHDHKKPGGMGSGSVQACSCGGQIAGRAGRRTRENLHSPRPGGPPDHIADLGDVLARGLADFAAFRTDVVFLCVDLPAGRARVGATGIRLRIAAAGFSAGLGICAGRSLRCCRALRNEPAPRSRARSHLGGRGQGGAVAIVRGDRLSRPVADGDLSALAARGGGNLSG